MLNQNQKTTSKNIKNEARRGRACNTGYERILSSKAVSLSLNQGQYPETFPGFVCAYSII